MPEVVPKLPKSVLQDRVSALNLPFSNDPLQHPLVASTIFLQAENPHLVEWAERVSANINQGFAAEGQASSPETAVFQNSFLAAYDLISSGYAEAGIDLPTIARPPDYYSWLGFEKPPTIDKLFASYNKRQQEVADEYTDYIEALVGWGTDTMAQYTPMCVGLTALAGSEVYLCFRDHQRQS